MLTLCPVELSFESLSFTDGVELLCPLFCCPRLSPNEDVHLALMSYNTSPPGFVMEDKWLCRRENEMTVFNCSSGKFFIC